MTAVSASRREGIGPRDGAVGGGDRARIGEMLVGEGVLTAEQLDFALRVQAKLRYHERIGKVIEELRLVDTQRLREAIRRHRRDLSIPEILLDLGLLQARDLDAAERASKRDPERSVESILRAEHAVDEDAVLQALAEKFDLPVFVPRMDEIDARLLQDESLSKLRSLQVVPLRRRGEGPARVAIPDPRDAEALRVVRALFGDDVAYLLATPTQISAALAAVEVAQRTRQEAPDSQAQAGSLLRDILAAAYREGASDIHIEPLANSVRVRFRSDGLLRVRFEFPRSVHQPLINRIKVLCEADITERRLHQDGRMLIELGEKELDVRVSLYVSLHGESAALRILTKREGLPALGEVGFAPGMLRSYVEDVIEPETGIVILTGPTGTGKTTTLAASIAAVNRIDVKIITAEDPIEYPIDGVVQCPIKAQIGRTYEETLRAMVRQDPDVIVLGEMRDEFSANVAVRAALTGHKVFTTFHTEDSVGALLRLLNMGIPGYFVASSVRGVLAQRLVRRTCVHCAQPYAPAPDEIRRSGISARDARHFELLRGTGCDRCGFTGYRGRIALFELLALNDGVRDQLLASPSSSKLRQEAIESANLVTLREDGVAKAVRGLTTLEEVARHTPRVERLRDVEAVLSLLRY